MDNWLAGRLDGFVGWLADRMIGWIRWLDGWWLSLISRFLFNVLRGKHPKFPEDYKESH